MSPSQLFLFVVFLSVPAWSIVEFRFHYTSHVFNAEEMNSYLETSPNSLSGIRDQASVGGEILYVLNKYPFLFGVRYDQYSKSKVNSGTLDSVSGTYTLQLTHQLVSLVTGYRITNMKTYFGFIAGIGVSSSATVTIDTSSYTANASSPYFAGFELGARGQTLALGTEFGYSSMSFSELKLNGASLTNASGAKVPLNQAGPYLRLVLTFMF